MTFSRSLSQIALTLVLSLSIAFCFSVLSVSASETWTQKEYGNMQSVRGLAQDGDVLIAVGNSGYMMRSSDAGSTWNVLDRISSVWWHDVVQQPNGVFVTVGESGTYATSSDQGVSWTSASLGVSANLYDIDRTSSQTGYIVGEEGEVLFYASGTSTWNTVDVGVTEDLFAVQDNGDGTAWVVGAAGRLLKATNSGLSWANLGRVSADDLHGVYFSSASKGWVVGKNGTFRTTSDGGSVWTDISVNGLAGQHLYAIDVYENRIVVSGDKIVLLSDDGGETWVSQSFIDENITFYAAHVEDENHVWVAGTNYDVFSAVYEYAYEEDVVEEEIEEEIIDSDDEASDEEASYGTLITLTCEVDAEINDPCRAVYYYATDGKRHAFPNEKIYFTWFEGFDDVVEVEAAFLASIPLGANVTYHPGKKMVKFLSVPTVYAVSQGGLLRAIDSELVAEELYGEQWNTFIDDIPDAFYGNYSFGELIEGKSDYDPDVHTQSVSSLDDNF